MLMLAWLLTLVGVAGFGIAGYKDLRTTEFPDWLPYAIIVAALGIRGTFSYFTGDWTFLTNSILVGLAFLGGGLALYYAKQWGDGDAWLLGALGFLFPDAAGLALATPLPFPLILLFNLFLVSLLYLIAYSIALGIKNPGQFVHFKKQLRKEAKGIATIFLVFTGLTMGLLVAVMQMVPDPTRFYPLAFGFPPLLLGLLFFVQYGRFIEQHLFRKKIPVKSLRVGDVPAEDKWRVLSAKEIAALRKRGGTITVKEGVRFAPVFAVTVLVTVLWGSLLFA